MRETEYPGKKCFCGHQGCIETFLCGGALADDFKSHTGEEKTAKEIVALSRQGDGPALQTLAKYQDRLARALAMLINIYDPDIIVLGCGLSNINEIYFGLNDKVAAHAFTTDRLETKILKNQHGDSSGVRGAAWLGAGPKPFRT
jgi:fructokinase